MDNTDARKAILHILKNAVSEMINDVTEEDDHIIVTLDTADGYQSVIVEVSDLGFDYLEHESG